MRPEDLQRLAREFFRIPAPPLQKRWAQEWDSITTHTLGKYPKHLIGERRPFEDEAIKDYRKKNWRPITRDPFSRALTNLQRILGKSQVTITYPEQLKEYLTGRNFQKQDFDGFFNRLVIRRMINDANGYLIWWPDAVPAPNVPIEPKPYLVLSKNMRHVTDEFVSWLSNEKSPVITVGPSGQTETRNEGEVYFIVSDTHYLKMVQVGQKAKRDFELRVHYVHNLGYMPLMILGGEETMETNKASNEDEAWLTSFFGSAVPFADECLNQFSDHQGVMVSSTSPIREMDAPKCTNRLCKGTGWIDVPADRTTIEGANLRDRHTLTGRVRQMECPDCHGTGRMVPSGPYGILYRAESNIVNENGAAREVPVLRFISPEVDIVKYSGDYWDKLLQKVDKALNLLFIEEAQSGKAKEIDREDKVSTLDRIGQHYYLTLVRQSIVIIGQLRSRAFDEKQVVITLPATFVVKTEDDLFASMEGMRKNGMSALFTTAGTIEIGRTKYPGNLKLQRMSEILAAFDPLFGMTPEHIAAAEGLGSIDPVMSRTNILAPAALLRLTMRDETFLEKEYDAIAQALEDEINSMAPEPPPAVQKVEDERNRADEAAKAKAKQGPPAPVPDE